MHRFFRPLGPITALALMLGLFFPGPASSREEAPRRGALLVADEKIADPRFRQSVILIIDHGMRQTAGLIINQPTGLSAGRLPLDLPALADRPLYYGGPVEPGRAHLLLRTDAPPEGAEPIVDEVHYIGSRAALGDIDASSKVRLFLGYAGWAAGQLAAEIERGDWHVVPGDAEAVFSEDPGGLWRRLHAQFDAMWI